MTTLITGTGLVGTSFAQIALERGERLVFFDFQPRGAFLRKKLGGADVVFVQRDVLDLPALIQTIQEYKAETVLHTAGLIGARVAEPLYTGLQINVMGTVNVAEAVRLTGVKRLIHTSTLGVYDRRREGSVPLNEDFARGDGTAYSNSKVAKELMIEAYQRLYGFEVVVLRLANVYGVGHFWAGSTGGQKVQTLLECGLRGEVARIPNSQTMSFEYVYAKDIGRAIDLAATVPVPAKNIFNVGSGEVLSFDQLTAVAKKVLPNLTVEVIPGPPPSFEAKQPMDRTRAKELLGWEPQYSMEAAFEDYLRELSVPDRESV